MKNILTRVLFDGFQHKVDVENPAGLALHHLTHELCRHGRRVAQNMFDNLGRGLRE